MEISGLEYFISVAETQNFTKAAQQCAITQTAMSQHINNMEKKLGFKLFDRSTRHVTLTPAGRAFYERAQDIVKAWYQAVHDSQDVASGKSGSIRVHVLGHAEGMLLLPRFKRFREKYPNVNLEVRFSGLKNMLEQLEKGLCDIIVCELLESSRQDIVVHHIADFRLDLMCNPSHPLAGRTSISAKELEGEHLATVDLTGMLRTQNTIRRQWDSLGLTEPETTFLHDLNMHEDIALQILLDESLLVPLPEYVKSHLKVGLHFIPIKDNLKFSLSAAVLKSNPKEEVNSLIHILTSNKLPLNY